MNIVQAMNDRNLFAPFFRGASWDNWRTILKATSGIRLDREERAFFATVAERDPPRKPVRELWAIAGRRAGKDSIASMIAAHRAAIPNYRPHIRPGEVPLVLCLAVDKIQATIVKGYAHGYFDKIPLLASLRNTKKENLERFLLRTGVELAVKASNFRVVRGRAIPCCIFDECAFWRDDTSTSPDTETYAAVVPGMATMPDPLLMGISTPYRKAGLLYNKFKASFGKSDSEVLVIRAPSRLLNPTLEERMIAEAIERDPFAASSEWLAEWRNDISGFLDREAVEAITVKGRKALRPEPGITYRAFVDPSGGSADSMTLAIAHRTADKRVILDACAERRPPFSPEAVVKDFAELLTKYGIDRVSGDRYAGEWPRERFRAHGIQYDLAEQTASDYYRDALPLFNSHQVELLDVQRLTTQLSNLERRTSRSGKDTISHPAGTHDDLANACCGALVIAAKASLALNITPEILARARQPNPFAGRSNRPPVFC